MEMVGTPRRLASFKNTLSSLAVMDVENTRSGR